MAHFLSFVSIHIIYAIPLLSFLKTAVIIFKCRVHKGYYRSFNREQSVANITFHYS